MKLSSNKRFFLNIVSAVLGVYGLSALPCIAVAAFMDESGALVPLACIAAVCIIACALIRRLTDFGSSSVRPRMNYLTTVISWLILIALTSVVYYFGIRGASWYDCVFEAAASLTATGTGSLGLSDLPQSLCLWRSLLNWYGGIGIILIAASCIRTWAFSGRSLVSVEMPGSEFLRTSSTFKITCRWIIRIYIALTAAEFVLLCIAGMPVLTSVMTSLSSVSTAGLQHINNGVITALPVSQKIIISLFSFLGSLNITVMLAVCFGRSRMSLRHTETINYTVRILITSAVITVALAVMLQRDTASSAGDSIMQTVSFLSTSGYAVTDYGVWPEFCRVLIFLQMFIGACAVSTGGGIKTARTEIGFKTIRYGLFRYIHPNSIRPVTFDREPVKPLQIFQSNLYISFFMAVYIAGVLLLSIDNKNESIYDALIYSQAMLTNTGTSALELGASAEFSALSRLVMSAEMLCGRLEIYPLIMLFFRSFWKADSNR